jgi:hypothetical protein
MGNETPGLRQAGGSLIAAVSLAAATPSARQARGNQNVDQAASQPPAVPTILSLKELAHADTAVVRQTIDVITQDLKRYVLKSGSAAKAQELVSSFSQSLVDEGVELQRSVDFKNQGQAKIWALRVLSWIGSVVTLGALPGLTKLIAPESDFADSLSRCLFGNGPDVDPDKLEKFQQLLGKFQELHGADQTVMARTLSEINGLMIELKPRKVSENFPTVLCETVNEILRDNVFDDKTKEFVRGQDKHFQIDWNTAVTDAIFSQENPTFPKDCFFEKDLFRGPFTLTIGGKSLKAPEDDPTRQSDSFKQKTRRFVLDQIDQLASEKGLNRVNILRNSLRTYAGQSASGTMGTSFQKTSIEGSGFYSFSFLDHIPVTISINNNGLCTVSHEKDVHGLIYLQESGMVPVPCDIHMTMAYESSPADFTSGKPPHAIANQCTCEGRYLDMSAVA